MTAMFNPSRDSLISSPRRPGGSRHWPSHVLTTVFLSLVIMYGPALMWGAYCLLAYPPHYTPGAGQ